MEYLCGRALEDSECVKKKVAYALDDGYRLIKCKQRVERLEGLIHKMNTLMKDSFCDDLALHLNSSKAWEFVRSSLQSKTLKAKQELRDRLNYSGSLAMADCDRPIRCCLYEKAMAVGPDFVEIVGFFHEFQFNKSKALARILRGIEIPISRDVVRMVLCRFEEKFMPARRAILRAADHLNAQVHRNTSYLRSLHAGIILSLETM